VLARGFGPAATRAGQPDDVENLSAFLLSCKAETLIAGILGGQPLAQRE